MMKWKLSHKSHKIKEMRQDFHDTNFLPFPHRNRRIQTDEQFGKFIEVIQKLYINIPLLDTIHVPTYAKNLRDILNRKRPLPTTEVIKLTEECSAAILNISPTKKDLGCPTIDCSIGDQHFNNALCDLGASVSVIPKVVFNNFSYSTLSQHQCAYNWPINQFATLWELLKTFR
jgi:hypothetical protein